MNNPSVGATHCFYEQIGVSWTFDRSEASGADQGVMIEQEGADYAEALSATSYCHCVGYGVQ